MYPFGKGNCWGYWLGHHLINQHDPRNKEPLDDKPRVMIKIDKTESEVTDERTTESTQVS